MMRRKRQAQGVDSAKLIYVKFFFLMINYSEVAKYTIKVYHLKYASFWHIDSFNLVIFKKLQAQEKL